MKPFRIAVLLGIVLFACAFIAEEKVLFQAPSNWPPVVYDFSKNELSSSKILLGRVLFYDPILSKDNTISCASCHLQFTAFTHIDHALSHGIDDKVGTRNSPALMNLAWHKSFMWDGAIHHLDMQALAPIAHPAEMGYSIDSVIVRLQADEKYRKLFYNAFKDSMITGEHLLKSIAAFELTLISADSKYDSVQRMQATFTLQEANGYSLFKKNCSSCHTEPLFTSGLFENNGLPEDSLLHDHGRMNVTQNIDDQHKFKVPSLRNIEFSYPYMHDGRYKRLSEVINHYTKGIVAYTNLSPQLEAPIQLNPDEKVDLIAFLLTLSDRHFLFNKDYRYKDKNIIE